MLSACLPNTDDFTVANPPMDAATQDSSTSTPDAALPEDAGSLPWRGRAHDDCLPAPECTETCAFPWLLTPVSVGSCNGIVARHSLAGDAPCLCRSYVGLFDSSVSDALFVPPNTMLVVGFGHLANLDAFTGESRWSIELATPGTRRLEPGAGDDEVYVVSGPRGVGPVEIRRVSDGGSVRALDWTDVSLRSVVSDPQDRNILLGINSAGLASRYDASAERPLGEIPMESLSDLSTLHGIARGTQTRFASVTASNNARGFTRTTDWPQLLPSGVPCPEASGLADATPHPVRNENFLLEAGSVRQGVFWQRGDSCTRLLGQEDFPGPHVIHRTRAIPTP